MSDSQSTAGNAMLTAPNITSLVRVPLGVSIGMTARNSRWEQAFALLNAALISDWLDGELATRLSAESTFGRDVLEPVCDSAVVAGATYGLLATHSVSPRPVLAVGALAAIGQTVIFTVDEGRRLKSIANGAMPLGYTVIAGVLWYAYARLAFAERARRLLPPAIAATSAAAYMKRGRLNAWLHGRAF